MCGIVGIFSKYPIDNHDLLITMRDAMVHRGPDTAGAWWSEDKRIGMAHRRLAIIDLSAGGYQPMEDCSGRYVVTLNGEIYNHQKLRNELREKGHIFRSRSDTEVLLESYKEWGNSCLNHLIGAFAFAIYDRNRNELFLARDRAGEKPLFYKKTDNRFVFASELKALMADRMYSRELDLDGLDYYLTYGYTRVDKTIIKDTNKLAPGHAMVVELKTNICKIWRYWQLPKYSPDQDATVEDYCGEIEFLLTDAVSRQLVSDVPVGILLSGGIDSSLITAIAAKVSPHLVKTFTISFPGNKSFDEAPYARIVAEHFGTDHTELVAEPSSVSCLPQLARQFDEPLADHSILPASLLAHQAKSSITVALGGDGGDELFGGYPHYNFLQKIEHLKKIVPENARRFCSMVASSVLPPGTKGRNHIIGFKGSAADSISMVNLYFDHDYRRKLLSPIYQSGYISERSPESIRASYFDDSLDIVQNATRIDFQTILIGDFLVKADRASMLHSLELRTPFLDHLLIEFAFSKLPTKLRTSSNERKIILCKLAQRLLPPELDILRKQGLTLPLDAWFKGGWGQFMTEVLVESDAALFNKKLIMKLVKAQKIGLHNSNRLFALTMFELWRREYNISLPI